MIPDTLNPEIYDTTVELQNEIQSTEIKNSDNKSLISVKIREILKEENADGHESGAEIINVINMNTAVSNVQVHGTNAAVTNIYRMDKRDTSFRKVVHGYPENNKRGIYSKDYWVQLDSVGLPEGTSPMEYDTSRNSFVATIFTITFIMLAITAGAVGYVYYTDELRAYMHRGWLFIFVPALVGMIMLDYALMCTTCARKLPCSVVVLVLALIFMSVLASYITSRYRTDIIFLALVATAATVLVCLFLALTSFDFTKFLLYIIAISVAFAVLALVVSIVSLTTGIRYKPLHLVILAIGTLINIVMLIMELQMILGGKAVQIGEDEWALGAFMLYTSIMSLFMKLVQLLGGVMDDD